MVEIVYSARFLKLARKLPKAQIRKLAKLLEIFQIDSFHSTLHTKPLSGQLIGF